MSETLALAAGVSETGGQITPAAAAVIYDAKPPASETPAAPTETVATIDPALVAVDPVKAADPAPAADPVADAAPDYSALALPDGVDSTDPLLTAFTTVAGEHKLSPEVAQAVVDQVSKALPALHEQFQAAQAEAHKAKLADWEAAVRADPEIGGSKLDPALKVISAAMGRYGDADAIRTAMDETGAGNHPALIKFMHAMSLALSEASPVNGGRPIAPKRSVAERMYDNSPGSRAA